MGQFTPKIAQEHILHSYAFPFSEILQLIYLNGLKIAPECTKSSVCTIPKYQVIWCPQTHCICDLQLGLMLKMYRHPRQLQMQCVLNVVRETRSEQCLSCTAFSHYFLANLKIVQNFNISGFVLHPDLRDCNLHILLTNMNIHNQSPF